MGGSEPDYRLSPRAVDDLEEIWLHSARTWSVVQADVYHRQIIAQIDRLAAGELRGRPLLVSGGYLKSSVGAHFVIFRHREGAIDVIRILHQSMDIPRHL